MTTKEKILALKEAGFTAEEILAALAKEETPTTRKKQQNTVKNLLLEIGIPAHLLGFNYLEKAINLYYPGIQLVKELYPRVAKEFNATPSRVERSIRHSIEVTFLRNFSSDLSEIFGNSINPKKGFPTNSEFIAAVWQYINE